MSLTVRLQMSEVSATGEQLRMPSWQPKPPISVERAAVPSSGCRSSNEAQFEAAGAARPETPHEEERLAPPKALLLVMSTEMFLSHVGAIGTARSVRGS